MTCVIGLIHGKKVYIGADSCGSDGYLVTARRDPKVFVNSGFLFGFTSSYRMGQLLRFAFRPPERPKKMPMFEYMVTSFVEEVRKCLKDGGFARVENGVESGGVFLVGHRRMLFRIDSDYQVVWCQGRFDAVGCGTDVALGAMTVTNKLHPIERIRSALKAASKYSESVRGSFQVMSV